MLPREAMRAAHRYLLFYKPYGVLSQFTPEPGSRHQCLGDFVKVPDVYPAGRLDGDSEGLVLLTSDGDLQHVLTDPRYGHPRTYWVQVEGIPGREALDRLRRGGMMIQGYFTRPAAAHLMEAEPDLPQRHPPIRMRKEIPTAWLELTLTEGRNRQVRRMTAATGYPTLRLVRAAIGPVTLAGMMPGGWRDLHPEEVEALRAGLAPGTVRSLPRRKRGSGASR
ncbi:MAG: pseudouridine synthase [Bryobacterales bacterium]|nr:pseudouridine synthase [Bryobacterales bacterium]